MPGFCKPAIIGSIPIGDSMANVKKGNLTTPMEWAKHLRKVGKKFFWGKERAAEKREIIRQVNDKL